MKKILTLDIETKPGKVYTWGMFNQNHSIDQIIEPDGVLMIGTKWHGDDTVRVYTDWKDGQRGMLSAVSEEIAEADAMITYNGAKFDIPHIKTGLLRSNLPPLAPATHIDLYKFIRSQTRFLSGKLGYIGPELQIGKKIKTAGFQLWIDVMNGNKEAQARMEEYCVGDVLLTEELYDFVKGHIPNHPNLGHHDPESCPSCNSLKTQKRGLYYTRMYQYQRHQCTNCGGWFKTTQTKIKKT